MAKVTRSTPTTERTMFIGDTHVPFHDPKAIALTLDFAEWLKPSSVYLLGDICDFYRLSRWDKDPKRIETLQDELDQTVHFLDQVRNIVGASCKVYYLEGNHERRIEKYCITSAMRSGAPDIQREAEHLRQLYAVEEVLC